MSEHDNKNSVLHHDLRFPYRLILPANASGECLFVLHGSGVDETTLVPLATVALALRMKTVPASPSAARRPFMSVAAAVWMPGLGAAFGSLLISRYSYHAVFIASSVGRFSAALLFAWLLRDHH